MASIYDHPYIPVSVYGNAVSLISENSCPPGVHVDIGCGYGAIAEPIRDELGLDYVGFDFAVDGLAALAQRGFEGHRIDLRDLIKTELVVRDAVGSRRIASISILDTLEHVVNGREVVAWLRRLADGSSATLVVSVPNASHKDVALKLLIGRWDVTEAGLLDHTHVECYTETRLSRLMIASGWRQVGTKDWLLESSDQRFPETFPLHDPSLPIGQLLRQLVEQANPHLIVNQFVRAYRPDVPKPVALLADRSDPVAPQFSILLTTRDGGAARLGPALESLAQQSCQDFQLIIVAASGATFEPLSLGRDALPPALQSKTLVLDRRDMEFAAALNVSVTLAAGRHLIVMAVETEVSPEWLSTFAKLSAEKPRSVLRVAARVDEEPRDSLATALLPANMRMLASAAAFAIPAGAFHHLGLRFDEKMLLGEEFDLIARAAMLCGTASSDSILIIDRTHDKNDRRHCGMDKAATLGVILNKLNNQPILLPSESVFKLLDLENRLLSKFGSDEQMGLRQRFHSCYRSKILSEEASSSEQPFLSVITRTMGMRNRTLRETLMSLAGQTSQNFEVLLVVHADDDKNFDAVRKLALEFPASLSRRIKLLRCLRGGRAAPLNEAIVHARGKYVSVLDDDDFAFAHWVETFENMAKEHPYSMLRATCVRQDYEMIVDGGSRIPRATSWFKMEWPSQYHAVDHLCNNFTPFMSVALPIAAFTTLGLRWDETLNTAEDWQLTTHVAMNCGVVCSPEVTAVYRWWTNSESSLFLHTSHEWSANLETIIERLDQQPILLPAGSVARIRGMQKELQAAAEREKKKRPVRRLFKRLRRSIKKRIRI